MIVRFEFGMGFCSFFYDSGHEQISRCLISSYAMFDILRT